MFFVYSNYKLGNIHEDSLKNIWKNVDNVVDKMSENIVKRCNNKSCGGCPGIAYILNGSVDTCDIRCYPEKKLISSCIRRYRVSEKK